MSGIGIGIVIFVIMAPYTGMLILIGYRIGIKYDYMMCSNYYKRKGERYPIEIEKKYLKHIGVPLLIMGLSWMLFSFIYAFSYTTGYHLCTQVLIAVTCVIIVYLLIVPEYIAKKELKKLSEN